MTTPYLGSILLFAGNFAIQGYAKCNGQLMSIADNEALYTLLGTTYGGDGQNTFGLPNLQSRTMVGQGTGAGLSPKTQGQLGGTESVTLTSAQLPSHTHTMIATTVTGTATVPTNNLLAAAPSTSFLYLSGAAPGANPAAPQPAQITLAGGNQPHTNIMPCLALTYLIALVGVYPSQN